MLVIGLTGGIGSGKSTAADLFAALGAEVIDTDRIAHALTAPGQPAIAEIAAVFGPELITAEGALDRAAMRKRVFEDIAAKNRLEDILHPRIRQAVAEQLAQPTQAPYRILVVPLLFETDSYRTLIQRILVVDCPEPLQIQRAMSRSKLNESDVQAIIDAQISREARLHGADDVILNDSSLENLEKQVSEFHKKYLRLA
jgi:dephospho-CoA kinase